MAKGYKNIMEERIDWHTLWMTMALAVSQRSIDPSTKHGCIIIDKKNRLISMGYNSFPRQCFEEALPLTRPEKYKVIIHSETNSIINAGDRNLEGTTAYITGCPCTNCFGNMINAGISRIIYGPVGSYCIKEEDGALIRQMNISKKTLKQKIEIIKYEEIADIRKIESFLEQIKKYINEKVNQTDTING